MIVTFTFTQMSDPDLYPSVKEVNEHMLIERFRIRFPRVTITEKGWEFVASFHHEDWEGVRRLPDRWVFTVRGEIDD